MSENTLTPVTAAAPEPSCAVQRSYALGVALKTQASLRKHICASQMLSSQALFATVVICSFQAAEAEVAESKQVCGVGAARFLSVQPAGEE